MTIFTQHFISIIKYSSTFALKELNEIYKRQVACFDPFEINADYDYSLINWES